MLHSPTFDFNDEITPIGASYWVKIVEKILGHRGKPGTGHHRYLVKWKGYIPQKSSWQKSSDVKAPKAITA